MFKNNNEKCFNDLEREMMKSTKYTVLFETIRGGRDANFTVYT